MRCAYCTLPVSLICWGGVAKRYFLAKAIKGAICAPILLMSPFYIAARLSGVA
jgi:hypothetical protein